MEMEKTVGHSRLRGGRDLPMLHSLPSRLCVSAADAVEIAMPESDCLVIRGDISQN